MCENMTSSTKPEMHNVSQRRHRRTEPRPPATCTEIGEVRLCGFRLLQATQPVYIVMLLMASALQTARKLTHYLPILLNCNKAMVHCKLRPGTFARRTRPRRLVQDATSIGLYHARSGSPGSVSPYSTLQRDCCGSITPVLGPL